MPVCMYIYRTRTIITRSWLIPRILGPTILVYVILTSLALKNGVKNIQTAGYNGARTIVWKWCRTLLGHNFWLIRVFLDVLYYATRYLVFAQWVVSHEIYLCKSFKTTILFVVTSQLVEILSFFRKISFFSVIFIKLK